MKTVKVDISRIRKVIPNTASRVQNVTKVRSESFVFIFFFF